MERFARKTSDGRLQSLGAHLANVSDYAARAAMAVDLDKLAAAIGAMHDLGKDTPEFQTYLFADDARRGSVRHSIHGAKHAYDAFANNLAVAEIAANVIISHHGSLRDYLTDDGDARLLAELSEFGGDIPVLHTEFDVEALTRTLKAALSKSSDKWFGMSMLTKLLYSCLVDADRLDAYLVESGETYGETYTENKADWNKMLLQLDKTLAAFKQDGPMERLRNSVSEQCAKSGKRAPGIYKLEVPTGGGKTLASMRFALEHAKAHDLDRIVYVIPYLSILDQTAEKFRDIFGVDNMLEHHSNFLPDNPDFYKLHTDRWDVPLILTTQVQFLDSVFSAKGGGLRKLHHMANSVLIFDEVQSLPVQCMHLFNSAVNFLNEVCGSTFLLCTATQPLLDTVPHPIIMSDNPLIAHCGDVPKRTNIVNAVCPKGYSHSELASFVAEKHNGATLVIVNTKAAAKSLFSELKDRGEPVLHLSTNMCGAHREVVLKEIHRRLEVKENIICVSTQLIEAGVDISFECVVRDIAGLDSIYQAAGRCNRHGEFHAMKNVYVVNIAGENLERLADIKIGADITRRLFDEGNLDINEYYRRYFHLRGNTMDFKTRNGGTIYDLLTANTQGRNACRGRGETRKLDMASAIRTAADEFYVIAPGQTDIVAPYGESAELLEQYEKLSKQRGNKSDVAEQRAILRKLGRFSVSVYGFQLDELRKSGALSDCGDILMLATGFYDDDIGLNIDGKHDFLCL